MINSDKYNFHFFLHGVFYYLVGVLSFLMYEPLGSVHFFSLGLHLSLYILWINFNQLLKNRTQSLGIFLVITFVPFVIYNLLDFKNYIFVAFLILSVIALLLYKKLEKIYFSLSFIFGIIIFVSFFPGNTFIILRAFNLLFIKVLGL